MTSPVIGYLTTQCAYYVNIFQFGHRYLFQHFNFSDFNSPRLFTLIFDDFLWEILYGFGRMKMYTMAASLNKIIHYKKCQPAVEPYSKKTAHRKPHCALLITPRAVKLEIY